MKNPDKDQQSISIWAKSSLMLDAKYLDFLGRLSKAKKKKVFRTEFFDKVIRDLDVNDLDL